MIKKGSSMKSRERVRLALNHKETDKVPVDIGGSVVTGIHVTALDKLIKKLGLKKRIVKAFEPMMMLGLVEKDVIDALGGDVIGLFSPSTLLGYKNENWKPWRLPNGTRILIGEGFNYKEGADGSIYAFPNGDTDAEPSVKMPKNGFYFDNIVRQKDLRDHYFNARIDYNDQYSIFSDEECSYYEKISKKLYEETEYSVFGNFWLGGFGDIFHIPGPWLKEPKGIRDPQDWMMAHITHPDYIKDFFEMQLEIQLKNLELYKQAVGDRIDVIAVSGTDFGGQNGLLYSLDTYRELYKPYHRIINKWIHDNTNWKIFYHTCGSVIDLLDDFFEIGIDIVNPVQYPAKGNDLSKLKKIFGKKFVFWGGGIDQQKTLQFGGIKEVRDETRRNVEILREGGGYICSSIHNTQCSNPIENIIEFINSINE